MAERDRLQPGKPVTATGPAEEDREVVTDQLAATAREDPWANDQARSALLAATGRKPSDTPSVWKHGAANRGAAVACGVEIGR